MVPNLRSEGNDEKLHTEECGNLPLHEGQVVEFEVTKECGQANIAGNDEESLDRDQTVFTHALSLASQEYPK